MKSFKHYIIISENKTPRPERKIGKIKMWLSYFDKGEFPNNPHMEIEYTRRIKSAIPNAHWYFIGGKPMCKMSRYERRCRASEVYLVTTDGMHLDDVFEDTSVSKGYYGRWQAGSHWTDTFSDAKRHVEGRLTKKLERLAQEKKLYAAKG